MEVGEVEGAGCHIPRALGQAPVGSCPPGTGEQEVVEGAAQAAPMEPSGAVGPAGLAVVEEERVQERPARPGS